MAIENEDPEVVAKFPWQKALIWSLSAVVFLAGVIITNYRQTINTYDERITNFRTINKELKDEIKAKDAKLEEYAKYFQRQDSTNKAVLGGPARDLLKQLNR